MLYIKSSAAVAAFSLILTTLGYPAASPDTRQTEIDDLLGFDESLKQLHLSADDIFPEIRVLDDDDFDIFCKDCIESTAPEEVAPYTVSEEELQKRFIVGKDDRKLFNEPSYPYTTVGRLSWSNGVFCSGALVGPRHVLTARHCIVENATATFSPGFDKTARLGSGRITTAVHPPRSGSGGCNTKSDWAVAIIDSRLGDQLGWFGAKYPDRTQLDKPRFTHMGYPGDRDSGKRPYRQTGITVHSKRTFDCDATGPFYTDTDTAGGQSGGPHWETDKNGGKWIWGALSISVRGPKETYAGWSSGNQMVATISRLRKEFD